MCSRINLLELEKEQPELHCNEHLPAAPAPQKHHTEEEKDSEMEKDTDKFAVLEKSVVRQL